MLFRRLRAQRIIATSFSVWFALFSVAPNISPSCAMHGAADSSDASVPMDMSAEAMAGHEGHAQAEATESAPEPAHSCDCVSACCGLPTLSLVIAPPQLPASALRTVESTPQELAQSHAVTRDRMLPFANGPPEWIRG
jgi:hypothetical protein